MPPTAPIVFQRRIDDLIPGNADEPALAIFLAHRPTLLSYARKFTEQSEDVVQEAWPRFAKVMKGKPPADPVGYLYRVVRNLAIDRGRRKFREERVLVFNSDESIAEEQDAATAAPDVTTLARDELNQLQEALAELPERTRRAIEMRRIEGLKLKEIAERLEVSAPFVHQLIAEGLAFCRKRIDRT